MAKIGFSGSAKDESVDPIGGGGFAPKKRGIYWCQVMTASDGLKTSKEVAKWPETPMTKYELEVADPVLVGDGEDGQDGQDQIGSKVWHNVTWIPRGKGEKANPGHGLAVHWLHACAMPFEGSFTFDEQDFVKEQHCMVKTLLEVELYESKQIDPKTQKPFVNEKHVIREIYTDKHPAPAELPPPPKARAPKASQNSGVRTGGVAKQPVGAGAVDKEMGW